MKLKSETSFLFLSFIQFVQTQFHKPNIYHETLLSNAWDPTSNVLSWHTPTKWDFWKKVPTPFKCYSCPSFPIPFTKKIWAQALSHATYLISRLSSKFLKFKTHFHIFKKLPTDYSNTNVFGCLVFVSTHKKNITKPYPRSPKCIYLSNKHGFDLKFWGTRAS